MQSGAKVACVCPQNQTKLLINLSTASRLPPSPTFRVNPKECVEFFGITPESDCTQQLQEAKKKKMRYYSNTNFLNYNHGIAGLRFSA